MLKQRTSQGFHEWDEAGIEQGTVLKRLIGREGLEGHLQAYLLARDVDEFSPHTLKGYRHKLGLFVKFAKSIGITEAEQITSDHVRLFLYHKKETCNTVSIHNYYRDIHAFFNWLVKEKRLPHNPINFSRPKLPKKIVQPFTPDHLRQLLSLCQGNQFLALRNKAMLLIFLDTGIRLAEMAAMELDDLDLKRGIIKIHGKGAKERIVAIQKRTLRALLQYLLTRKDKLKNVWLSEERQPLTFWGIEGMIRRLGKRAGLQNVRCSPHTFRHTAATMSLENGAGEFAVQSMLGHETLYMTRRYTQMINSERAAEAHKRFSPVEHLKL